MDERTTNGIIMTGSAYVGFHTYFNASYGIMKFSHKIHKHIKYNTSPQFIQTMYNSTAPIIQNTGLYDYGVRIVDCSKQTGLDFIKQENENYEQYINKEYANKKNPLFKWFYEPIKKIKILKFKQFNNKVINGNNAYYRHDKKLVVINMEKSSQALPHELGHAINHKSLSKAFEHIVYGKLKNSRFISRSLLAIMMISFFTNRKDDSKKQDKNPLNPIALFIKNNCGKLAFLVGLPKLTEETIACIQGHKISKKFIPPEYQNIIKKCHIHSFSVYALQTIITAFSVYFANLARDYTVIGSKKLTQYTKNKKEQKNIQYLNSYNKIDMENFLK